MRKKRKDYGQKRGDYNSKHGLLGREYGFLHPGIAHRCPNPVGGTAGNFLVH
jgi:hypothetical protein